MGWFADHIRRFRADRSGAALVEFGMALPLMVLVSYVGIDGMRLMSSFQQATTGVREATRYLARVAPGNICAGSSPSLAAFEAQLQQRIGTEIRRSTLNGTPTLVPVDVFGPGVRLVSVTAEVACVTGTGLRQAVVPVATVSAEVELDLPFHRIFSQVVSPDAATFTATIEEQARIYGL